MMAYFADTADMNALVIKKQNDEKRKERREKNE
jgi:hypothetical protein